MKPYTAPCLIKGEKLSSVTAGANFSGKKAKPIQQGS
jgi:hypothetical protein